jgi:hypothetical protein
MTETDGQDVFVTWVLACRWHAVNFGAARLKKPSKRASRSRPFRSRLGRVLGLGAGVLMESLGPIAHGSAQEQGDAGPIVADQLNARRDDESARSRAGAPVGDEGGGDREWARPSATKAAAIVPAA